MSWPIDEERPGVSPGGAPGDPARGPRPSLGQRLGHLLVGLIVISGLVGALLLARPALDVEHGSAPDAPEAADNR
ncbi:hypothetical protein [Streptomyces hoynatensis]|uniref:Uncharacterized protein n=1 Tax=Streptomyces hoynatensis TaxID=1141874 RepID=A0A3A9YRI0_9ACTN|nr:hypothetical protein [Streptomyces hoynatensis]RKN38711.1 hypothetical protein D7294_23035 [Streptomyces hoynatensis]